MTRRHLPEVLALVAILSLAAVLRFGWTGISAFAGDEANIAILALQMARGGEFITMSKASSVGIPFAPLSVWVFVPMFWVTADPLFATLCISALSLLAVLGVWCLARHAFGAMGGLVAAVFMALSPYAIFYGRSIWEPNLLAPLSVAWALCAVQAITTAAPRRLWWMIVLTVLLGGVGFQVHFAAAPLALATLIVAVRWRWWRHWAAVLAGAFAAAVPLIPYVYTIACCSPTIWTQFQNLSTSAPTIDLQAVQNALNIVQGIRWEFFAAGGDYSSNVVQNGIALLCFAAGVLALGTQWVRCRDDANSAERHILELVAIWLLCSPLLFLRHTSPILAHYQLLTLPALAVVLAASVRLLPWRAWAAVPLLLMLGIGAAWTNAIITSLSFASIDHPTDTALASSLRVSRDAVQTIPTDRPLLYYGHGQQLFVHTDASVYGVLLWDRPHRLIDAARLLILPNEPSYLLFTLKDVQAYEEAEAAGLTANTITIARRPSEPAYRLIAYDGQAPEGFILLETPITFANGLQLEGWKARSVAGFPLMYISMLYRVIDIPPAGTTYQQFTHLRDANTVAPTTPPLMVSDTTLYRDDWRVGDRLITITSFTVESFGGTYWLDVGQYALESGQRFARGDGGDTVRLGSFVWKQP
jgi:4-amino-4-deoxy-L-arabinose transferase-like glycosyltransferase